MKTPFTLLATAILSLLFAANVSAADAPPAAEAEGFFRPGPEAPEDLPEDRVFPQGRLFPFSFFSVHGNTKDRVAGYGTTMFGPQYRNTDDRVLAGAKERGVHMLYRIGMSKDEVRSGELTDEQIVESVRGQVERVMHEDAIAWWYLVPEELRHWRRGEIRFLELAAQTIRETDPKGRPVWMYDPGHRSAGSLTHTARHLDILGKGMYTNYSGRKEERVWCRWTIEQQIEALRRAEREGAMQIAVPEMFRQPEDEELPLVPAWVRHDVYCAMVAGAQGVVVFSAAGRRGFRARFTYLDAYGEVVGELCGELNLGQAFLFGERRDDLKLKVVEGPETTTMTHRSAGVEEPLEYPSVSWADIAFGERRILVAVNSTAEELTVEVEGLPAEGVAAKDLFQGDELEAAEGRMSLAFGPWGVRAVGFSPAE